MGQDHDAAYKMLFSFPEMVRDLIAGFLPGAWRQRIRFDTLERMPCCFVTEGLRQRNGDVLWRVRADGEWVYLWLEFQRTVDRFMAVRISAYLGLLYQHLIKSRAVPRRQCLPPVLPVVLYNGARRWRAATRLHELIPFPAGLDDYQPRQAYLLLDEGAYADHDLAGMDNLVATMFRFEHPSSEAAMVELVDLLNRKIENPELKRAFAIWLAGVVSLQTQGAIPLPKIHDLTELKMAMATHFDRWKQEWRREGLHEGVRKGRLEGRQEGEAELLKRLLTKRFGPLPDALEARINRAPPQQLGDWAERLLTASTLRDIFPN